MKAALLEGAYFPQSENTGISTEYDRLPILLQLQKDLDSRKGYEAMLPGTFMIHVEAKIHPWNHEHLEKAWKFIPKHVASDPKDRIPWEEDFYKAGAMQFKCVLANYEETKSYGILLPARVVPPKNWPICC